VYHDVICHALYFFFSSRRRHTRFSRDWSSDVCSSDLTSKEVLIKDTGSTPIPEPTEPIQEKPAAKEKEESSSPLKVVGKIDLDSLKRGKPKKESEKEEVAQETSPKTVEPQTKPVEQEVEKEEVKPVVEQPKAEIPSQEITPKKEDKEEPQPKEEQKQEIKAEPTA